MLDPPFHVLPLPFFANLFRIAVLQCFVRCPDGAQRDPVTPSRCWFECFFNTFLGNTTLGYPAMDRESLLRAWNQSFDSNSPLDGGCQALDVSIPPNYLVDVPALKADDSSARAAGNSGDAANIC